MQTSVCVYVCQWIGVCVAVCRSYKSASDSSAEVVRSSPGRPGGQANPPSSSESARRRPRCFSPEAGGGEEEDISGWG